MTENSDSTITLNISSPTLKPKNDEVSKRPRITGSRVILVIVIGIRDLTEGFSTDELLCC